MLRQLPKRKLYVWGGVVLAAGILFGNKGFRKMVGQFREKKQLEKQIFSLRQEHARLARELDWIETDPTYSEYLIRKHLGYVKKGEVEYRLITSREKEGRAGKSME